MLTLTLVRCGGSHKRFPSKLDFVTHMLVGGGGVTQVSSSRPGYIERKQLFALTVAAGARAHSDVGENACREPWQHRQVLT